MGVLCSIYAIQFVVLQVGSRGADVRCFRHAPGVCGCSLGKFRAGSSKMSSKTPAENPNTLKSSRRQTCSRRGPPRNGNSGHLGAVRPNSTSSQHNFSKVEPLNRQKFSGACRPRTPSRKHRARLEHAVVLADTKCGKRCSASPSQPVS